MTLPTRPEREVLEVLGTEGVVRVLDDMLDQGKLVRLANACGISYPGMRTQSQSRDRLLADLAERATREEPAWRAIHKVLLKQTAAAAREWAALAPAERLERLRRVAGAGGDGSFGLGLFLAASAAPASPDVDSEIGRMLVEARRQADKHHPGSPEETPSREAARLAKKVTELKKKAQHLEGQLQRARETEKQLKRDLLERKGELAESRMLAERLRRELEDARTRAKGPSPLPGTAVSASEEVVKELRRLAAEQRRLLHRIEKLSEPRGRPAEPIVEALAPALEALSELQKDAQALHRDRRKEFDSLAARLEEIQSALRGVRDALEAQAQPPRHRGRRKGEPPRVGVFVDVQNMYYSARQLQGKLDFDALLQAAVLDRRLILARAYVVESKEIDQSGFIAMLEQRGIEVRRKTVKVRADGSMKGDWDMEMALDILEAAPKLDVVVLVSGDGDFTSLVNRVKGMGPRVEVIAFPKNTAKSLVEAADGFHPLDRKYMIRTAQRPDKELQVPPAPSPDAGVASGSD